MFGLSRKNRKIRYEVTTAGVIDLPAIGIDLTTGRWWSYEQDGTGGGGPLSRADGTPVEGRVGLASWQEEISMELATLGWWWLKGSDWTFVMRNGIQMAHRPVEGA